MVLGCSWGGLGRSWDCLGVVLGDLRAAIGQHDTKYVPAIEGNRGPAVLSHGQHGLLGGTEGLLGSDRPACCRAPPHLNLLPGLGNPLHFVVPASAKILCIFFLTAYHVFVGNRPAVGLKSHLGSVLIDAGVVLGDLGTVLG